MSTHREIEEVYREDIIKKQKMTKGIIGESLGEISKMGEEMKYCCDEFKKTIDDWGAAIEHGSVQWSGMTDKDKWYIIHDIEMDCGAAKYKPIKYCPFCGEELKLGK